MRCRWSRLAPTPPEWPLGYAPSHGGAGVVAGRYIPSHHGDVPADVTEPSVLTDTLMVCASYGGAQAKTIVLDVSLNTGQDFHGTGQHFVFYDNPTLLRTGCLGAKKGCLITGPTFGGNPMQVTGLGFNAYVDYERARCKFSSGAYVFIDRIAYSMHSTPEIDFVADGLSNGSIALDGSYLYCITPAAEVRSKIVPSPNPITSKSQLCLL